MTPFKKEFVFKIENNSTIVEKLKNYFKIYSFQFKKNENKDLVFFKKFSFFQGWKINPLNWESKITISISDNNISIKYTNEGNAHITPFAFENLFNTFFKNLELYLNKSIPFEANNQTEIKKAKQKILLQFSIIIIGIFLFVALGRFLINEFNFHLLSKFSIAIGGILSLKMLNQYWLQKLK